MDKTTVIQGHKISPRDIEIIKKLTQENPSWGRTRLSKELCIIWDLRSADGNLKDMSCRNLLLKLEKKKMIKLPQRKSGTNNRKRNSYIAPVAHSSQPIAEKLHKLAPIKISTVEDSNLALFKCFLAYYHYLGFSGTVGQNLKYMAFDRHERPLACLLFGSAAWACNPRDTFIGWDREKRGKNLSLLTNNMRFLILPWVRVAHLASHILGKVSRRVSTDWEARYGHPIYMLETFVEASRFSGTCYRASNWICVGSTKGRSRNDRYNKLKVPVKDIYLYPLSKTFRRKLSR